jgi:hypothetical protein
MLAGDGSVILVKPGVYFEQVKFTRARGIVLLSVDPARTIIDATDKYAAIEMRTDSNRVIGFTLRNADSHGVWVRDGHQTLERCVVYGNGDRGIYLSAMVGNASAAIDHCTVCDNGTSGIYAARDSMGTAVTNCIIAFNPRGVVTDRTAGSMTVEYNVVFSSETDFDRVVPGIANDHQDPKFRSRPDFDYRLQPGSPCIGTARDSTNRGCF